MKILVTGGAGYIGSHTCKYLAQYGHTTVTYDNLSTGHREMVKWGAFEHGDIRDHAKLRRMIHRYNPDGLIHFASSTYVGESVQNPSLYYENNVFGSLCIMQALQEEGVRPLVVSSSAAVYGIAKETPITENSTPAPINPYGRTKLVMELMLADFATAYNLPWAALRYFNAAGADPDGETGEWHDPETHLIPNVLKAIQDPSKPLHLFGNDYDTKDGTCIRDYIHVVDLAAAHVLALQYLLDSKPSVSINLGTGHGASIFDIIKAAEDVTGKKVPYKVHQRRPGDPSTLVANADRAKEILNWDPKLNDIKTIIATAWNWMQ